MEMEMIAEGYYATKTIHELNEKYQVKIPIVEAIYNILYEKSSPVIEIRELTGKMQ